MKLPNELTAHEAAAAIRGGTLTASALMQACLDRIALREPQIGAWQYIDVPGALAAARACDARAPIGLLHGVPVGIKDIIETQAMPTAYGSSVYLGNHPAWDAFCVVQMRRAGAIVLGKTVSTEFAYFAPGKTANPHNPLHTPGGSSSGSAAAVADMMVPLAFGTQTAASITRPASYCGVVGYKPSFASFNTTGIKPFAASLDTLGVITRDVGDAALTRAVLLGERYAQPGAWPGAPPAMGMCRTPWWHCADPATVAAVETAGANLRSHGARVEDVVLPADFAQLADTHKLIMAYEAARSLAYEYDAHRQRLSEPLAALIETGMSVPRERYVAACEQAQGARKELGRIIARYDALLAPSAPGEAPVGLAATGDPLFSRMWTLLHVPSVTLPGFRGPTGLPVGVQLVGAYGADDRLLRVAHWAQDRLVSAWSR